MSWYEEYNRVEVYKPKKLRKLRVVTREWRQKRHRLGLDKAREVLLQKSQSHTILNIIKKIERIEGNDIVKMIHEMIDSFTSPIKEVHVTGRIAKKIYSSDIGAYGTHPGGYITTIRNVPIIYNNDSFPDIDDPSYRNNPTGPYEWFREIILIPVE